MDTDTITLTSPQEENTRDHFVAKRSDGKRNYTFSYSKSRKCTHPRLTEMVIGASIYRCEECNFAFTITAGAAMPLHHVPKLAFQQLGYFIKEFGVDSLQEVIRWKTGNADGTPFKPAVPEGMSVLELWGLLETIITDVEDGGKEQFREVKSRVMVEGRDALTENEVLQINATVERFQENMLEGETNGRAELGEARDIPLGEPDTGDSEAARKYRFLAGVRDAADTAFRDRPKRPSPMSLVRKIQGLRLPHWGKRKP